MMTDFYEFSQSREDDLEAIIERRQRFEMLDPQFTPEDEHQFNQLTQLNQLNHGEPTPLFAGGKNAGVSGREHSAVRKPAAFERTRKLA